MSTIIQSIIDALSPYHKGETAYDIGWFKSSIQKYVDAGKEIPFVFLAFPGKSINPSSVSGHLPDLGEELAFQNLREMIASVGRVYRPGIELNIVSEGHCFIRTGCMRPSHEIDAYVSGIRQIKKSDRIKIYTIHDFYDGNNLDQKIDVFQKQYLPDIAEVYNAIENNPYYRRIYPDRIAFIYHEFTPVLFAEHSNSRRHAMAKLIARSFISHQMAVNGLIKDRFPNHIRLSIHQQNDSSAQKYYINLLPNVSGKGTPWFHVVHNNSFNMTPANILLKQRAIYESRVA